MENHQELHEQGLGQQNTEKQAKFMRNRSHDPTGDWVTQYSALHVKLHKQTHKNLFVYICNRPRQHHNVTTKVGNVTMSCFCHI